MNYVLIGFLLFLLWLLFELRAWTKQIIVLQESASYHDSIYLVLADEIGGTINLDETDYPVFLSWKYDFPYTNEGKPNPDYKDLKKKAK